MTNETSDSDPIETQEWLEAFRSLLLEEGKDRAYFVLSQVLSEAKEQGMVFSSLQKSPYCNTIATHHQPVYPGDLEKEAIYLQPGLPTNKPLRTFKCPFRVLMASLLVIVRGFFITSS